MGFCQICKVKLATHFCYGCGKYLCNSISCNAIATYQATIGRLFAGQK